MVLKAERERIKALLTEAITVLCKNGLGYKYTCGIEGLLGITLDDEDVFLVNINETIQGAERRPTAAEEETKESATAPQSPATASPSSTPRRRRRRSQDGQEGGSPAKRANYGDDQQQEPQNPDDVIVIKEEVSETEFSDFYGDTGGGNSQDGGQYAMPQGDQYGAGCSQWGDTSQTQGGQPEWPTFSPTQQQAAISQAASSAMMSPSQVSSEAVVPARSLYSKPVRNILSQHLVSLVAQNNWEVIGIRLGWPRDEATNEKAWNQIVSLRAQLDQVARAFPDSVIIVSAINGVLSGQRKVFPGVGYWIAARKQYSETVDCKNVLAHFNRAGATAKLLLQPYQKSADDYATVLYHLVKDNVSGCVPRYVQTSACNMYGPRGDVWEPVVKIYLQDPALRSLLKPMCVELEAANFAIPLVD